MLAKPLVMHSLGVLLWAAGPAMTSGPALPTPQAAADGAPAPASRLVVNVKAAGYGARGNGHTDDTLAIQMAVRAVAGSGGTVVVPAGVYLINPVAQEGAGIRLGSDMTLRLEPGAVLKALPTATSRHVMLLVREVQNVTIQGGTLVGNRNQNTITDLDENGMGVEITHSGHVILEGLVIKDFWADGVYVTGNAQDVTLCRVVASQNRRNGMSVVSVDGMLVQGCTFDHAIGSMEKGHFVNGSGVDLEPNPGQTVANVRFLGCTMAANPSVGLGVGVPMANTGRAFITHVLVDGNTFTGNGFHSGAAGIAMSNTVGHQISNNTVTGSTGDGIYLRNAANQILVTGNTVAGTRGVPKPGDAGNGIMLYLTEGNIIKGNTVTGSAACGIRDADPVGPNQIGPNQLRDNLTAICR